MNDNELLRRSLLQEIMLLVAHAATFQDLQAVSLQHAIAEDSQMCKVYTRSKPHCAATAAQWCLSCVHARTLSACKTLRNPLRKALRKGVDLCKNCGRTAGQAARVGGLHFTE